MHNFKKIILTALAVILVVAAVPLSAQIAGNWEGTGTGYCYPRNNVVIYPWQSWEGQIPNSEDSFSGEWYDAIGNQGIFESNILWISVTTAIANGSWYWYDPTGTADPVYGGDFQMRFQTTSDACNGTWTTIWLSPADQWPMTGWKVD